ncbi:hypothetical protein GCM10009839_24530 [Catenulispora yoronensis]|uniref:Uncharacterized protein n=1 Tax=Catenulispora yoronensis TaxID=450799 RepID=A0ABP5FIG4_9ACTN
MTTPSVPSSTPPESGDWSTEHRPEVLFARPEVQAMVAACVQNARSSMSAEEFLARAASIMPRPYGKAMLRGADRGRRAGLRLGLKTEKTQSAEFTAPIGHVSAAILCSLARNSQPVTAFEQREDGAALTAEIPSDRKTFGGTLTIEIRRDGTGTGVAGTAVIAGQIYDWGVCKKTLATLFADIPALLVA